ncbi:MAG: hypothetical protein MHMPM18_001611 [Marteilia pararefringens]
MTHFPTTFEELIFDFLLIGYTKRYELNCDGGNTNRRVKICGKHLPESSESLDQSKWSLRFNLLTKTNQQILFVILDFVALRRIVYFDGILKEQFVSFISLQFSDLQTFQTFLAQNNFQIESNNNGDVDIHIGTDLLFIKLEPLASAKSQHTDVQQLEETFRLIKDFGLSRAICIEKCDSLEAEGIFNKFLRASRKEEARHLNINKKIRDPLASLREYRSTTSFPSGNLEVLIRKNDLNTLKPRRWINDTIIDFYILYLVDKFQAENSGNCKILPLSALFISHIEKYIKFRHNYPKNKSNESNEWQEFLESCSKTFQIFTNDLLVMPICKLSHWFVLFIQISTVAIDVSPETVDSERYASDSHFESSVTPKETKCEDYDSKKVMIHITVADSNYSNLPQSLESNTRAAAGEAQSWGKSVVTLLKDLQHYENQPAVEIEMNHAQVVLQNNGFDCGIHLLMNVEQFIEQFCVYERNHDVLKFEFRMLRKYCDPKETLLKRREIIETILRIKKK